MDFEATAFLSVGAVPVFGYAQDLSTYPQWFSIVDRAAPDAQQEAVWNVELAARVGPFRTAKRVRMQRTTLDVARRHVRFERVEADGAAHSAWLLAATVDDADEVGCRLTMRLHYGGVGWVPGLDLLLREEAKRAGGRLERLLLAHGHR